MAVERGLMGGCGAVATGWGRYKSMAVVKCRLAWLADHRDNRKPV